MELYIIYAILSFIINWLLNFLYKIVSHKNIDVSVFNIINYFITSILAIIYYVFTFEDVNLYTFSFVFFLAFINLVFYLFSIFSRVESLKNIDTVIFFPIYKTIWPIFLTLVSIYYFWEHLTNKESIWIIIWIIVPLMLITKAENKIQKNLFLWLILMFVTAIFTAISAIASKELMVRELSFSLYLLIYSIMGLIFSYMFRNVWKKDKIKKIIPEKNIFWICILWGFLHFFAFYFYTKALEWNLAVVTTVNSFSILIPIILSIVFYKEHFNFKKWFVIFLSIVSLLLFI